MRVGLLIYGSLATISGGYLYDRMLVQHLRRAGHTVEIISLPWRSYPHHLGDNLSQPLRDRLRSLEVDLLLQDELNHPSLIMTNRQARPYPIFSIVHHLRGDETHPSLLRKFYQWVEAGYLRSVDGFICNSHTTQRRVWTVLQDRTRPSLVAYPAADHIEPPPTEQIHAQLEARVMQDGPLRMLFIGNLIPRKGLHTLLDACAALAHTEWQLEVVGSLTTDPTYTNRIRATIRRRRMGARVKLADSVPGAQLRQTLLGSHLLVVPSFEGFGIVYLEAMAYGLPVIATTSGAAREVVTVGETGYLIEPGDSAKLADLLRRLHRNRPHLAAMSVAARRRYDNHVTWQQSMDAIASWLQAQVMG